MQKLQVLNGHIQGRIAWIFLSLLAILFLSGATDHPQLTITGPAETQVARYDFTDMQSMQQVVVTTTTPWTDGLQEFLGVPLAAVLPNVTGAYDLRMTAINDYIVTMPSNAVTEKFPIIAYKRNGSLMTVRDKGPFWLIYPYDDSDTFKTEAMLSRSIWHLVGIEILQ
jgi:hypothetical protein